MVQAREHQLNQNENEVKLEQVQLRFPHDTLNLSQSLDFMEVSPCCQGELECVSACAG